MTFSLFIGAFIFAIGMQLANGCGSGVLFFPLEVVQAHDICRLPAFIIGSVLGSLIVPTALGWGSAGQIVIAEEFGPIGRWFANLILIFGVSGGLYVVARRRDEILPPRLIYASISIALLCWAVYVISGHPRALHLALPVGAKLAQAAGVPISDFAFWQWAGPDRALTHSVPRKCKFCSEYRDDYRGSYDCELVWRVASSKLSTIKANYCCHYWWFNNGDKGTTVIWLQYRGIFSWYCIR